MKIDPAQRALLWCVLEDALDLRLAPVLACSGCEFWMERGPCPAHQNARIPRYLGLSARLEAAAPYPAWPLSTAAARVIARAVPEALDRRRGSASAIDAGLVAAYQALAAQLAPGRARR